MYFGTNEMDMVIFFKQYGMILLGVVLGALAGFLYYKYVGCVNGTCAITSNPYISTLYGAAMGGLLFSNLK